ncbi:glycosyltransferase family 2 protein [Dokdonia sp. Hel_I_53]|uniref:glycosyltransferase family 2 protein n=1 Tax=Dokdonia sp. Hel_I_53 TaxID=1566287 RepID=UPI00119C3BE1|nr:glycosyltransferase family 2 protein [Dokdonia sp. Hel_I_53]TVZ51090.1 hypothetical protein OD90_0226 [Dokdonia sp. Hel_I_53]
MKIAIVILNWNGKSLLEQFLGTVVSHSEPLAEVYVIDNASTDNSVNYIHAHFPSVTVIQNSENGGYAKGYNDGLVFIESDVYVLLNSDIKVGQGWLEPMIKLFKNPTIGAAQPKIKDYKKPSYFEYAGAAGGFLDSFGYPFCRGRIFDYCEKDLGQYDDTIEVQWASGACLFIRALDFWQVGGLDERFFAHQEEIDLCWRIKNSGKKIIACGDSEVLHVGGATLATANAQKTFYNFRNTLFNIVKNVKGIKALFIVISRLVLDGIAGFKFLIEGKPKHMIAILRAHLSFYYYLPSFMVDRVNLKHKMKYATIFSIVWSYFISQKRTYKDFL